MEQYRRDRGESDLRDQQFPRDGRVRLEGGQPLLGPIHGDA